MSGSYFYKGFSGPKSFQSFQETHACSGLFFTVVISIYLVAFGNITKTFWRDTVPLIDQRVKINAGLKEIVCVTSVYSFNSFQLASLKCFSSACVFFSVSENVSSDF